MSGSNEADTDFFRCSGAGLEQSYMIFLKKFFFALCGTILSKLSQNTQVIHSFDIFFSKFYCRIAFNAR